MVCRKKLCRWPGSLMTSAELASSTSSKELAMLVVGCSSMVMVIDVG